MARVEHVDGSDASDQLDHLPQGAVWYMLVFSCFITLTGWICNFDLGKQPTPNVQVKLIHQPRLQWSRPLES